MMNRDYVTYQTEMFWKQKYSKFLIILWRSIKTFNKKSKLARFDFKKKIRRRSLWTVCCQKVFPSKLYIKYILGDNILIWEWLSTIKNMIWNTEKTPTDM